MANPLAAASAYAHIARLAADISKSVLPPPGTAQPSQTSFASVLKDAMHGVEQIGHKSDVATQAAANGKSNMM